jgi:CHAD domain-containing protein
MSLVALQDPAEDPLGAPAPLPTEGAGLPDPVAVVQLRAVEPAADPGLDPGTSAEAAQQAVEHLAISRTPEVLATDLWAEAGRKVLRFHLSRMLAKVPGTIAGEDPEEVHAMRVATRRVRAAWRVFGDGYERQMVRDHVGQLRTLGGRLGAVRDLDVQIAILAGYRDRRSKRDRVALTPLLEAWGAERAARHGELVERLVSPWFTDFVTDHEALVSTPGAGVRARSAHAPATLRMQAPAVAWEAYQAVWAFDDAVASADVATLHELRIAAKWLRYTLEFVREPMEPGVTELIRRVVVLQDQLGDIHDLDAAATLARGFASERPDLRPGQRAAIERFAATQDARVERLRRRVGPVWRGLADAEYRRGLGRSLARL